jgi:hypothetical protein
MPNDLESYGMEVPTFASGGLVKETGLAVVHEGEYIMPDPGSKAEIGPGDISGQGVINFYFPVEVVIVGTLPEAEKAALEARIWESLGDALERMT